MSNKVVTPLEVVQRRSGVESLHSTVQRLSSVNSLWYMFALGAFSLVLLFFVGAGQTPESVAQTTDSTSTSESSSTETSESESADSDSTETSDDTSGTEESTTQDTSDPSANDLSDINRGDENDPGTSQDRGPRNTIEGVYETDGSVSASADEYWSSPRLYANAVYSNQYRQATDACEFLVSCRYNGANLVGSAPVFGGGDYANVGRNTLNSIASVLLMVPQAVFQFVQIFLIYTLSIDMMTQSSIVANESFFKVGQSMFSVERQSDGSVDFNLPKIVTIIIAIPIVVAALEFAFRSSTNRSRSSMDIFKAPLISLFFGGFAIIMIVQSGKNVSEDRGGFGGAAIIDAAGDNDLVEFDSTFQSREISGNPDNWAFMSPGWMLASLSQMSEEIAAFAAQITNVMTNAVNNSAMREATQCDIYVNALHATFSSTPAAQRMGAGNVMTIISYDRMVNSLFYKNYAAGAMGDTRGAQNAWCRMAEVDTQRPAGQQAMISRVAGLNREAVGTGGLGIVMKDGRPNTGQVVNVGSVRMPNEDGLDIPVSGGTLVDAEGNWSTAGETITEDSGAGTNDRETMVTPHRIASQYFGPTYQLNENNSPAREQAAIYWAVCEWGKSSDNTETRTNNGEFYPGKEATINPEWKNVKWAKGGASSGSESEGVFTKKDCAGTIIAAEAGRGFGEGFTQGSVNSVQSAHFEYSVRTTAQAEDPTQGEEAANCEFSISADNIENCAAAAGKGLKTGAIALGDMVSGGAVTSASNGVDAMKSVIEWLQTETTSPQDFYAEKFESSQEATGKNPARDYLATVNGYNPTGTLVTAVFSLVVAYVIVKMVAGLLIGAMLVQVMTVIVFVMGSFILLLAIIPLRRIRNNLQTVVKTLITAILTDGFMAFMFSAIFAINELLKTMILPVTQDYATAAILGTFIAWLSLKAFSLLVRQISGGLDITRTSDSMKLAPMAIAPALQRAGFAVRDPMEMAKKFRSRFNRSGRRIPNRGPANHQTAQQQKSNKQAARENIRKRYADDRAMQNQRRREADELRRAKQQEAKRKRKRNRLAADSAEAAAVFTGYGAPVAGVHKAGSTVWRPFQDGTIKTKHGAEKAMRGAARKMRDGSEWSAMQARLLLLNDENVADAQSANFVDNVVPGDATGTPQQMVETGTMLPNEDNVKSFDDKVPGGISGNSREDSSDVASSLAMHEEALQKFATSNQASRDIQEAMRSDEDAHTTSDRLAAAISSANKNGVNMQDEVKFQSMKQKFENNASALSEKFKSDGAGTIPFNGTSVGENGTPVVDKISARFGGYVPPKMSERMRDFNNKHFSDGKPIGLITKSENRSQAQTDRENGAKNDFRGIAGKTLRLAVDQLEE